MISLEIVLKACNFIKKRFQHIFLSILQNVLGLLLYKTTQVAPFEVSFSIRKEHRKERQWRDCLCINKLVSCTNTRALQAVHLLREHLSLLQNLLLQNI